MTPGTRTRFLAARGGRAGPRAHRHLDHQRARWCWELQAVDFARQCLGHVLEMHEDVRHHALREVFLAQITELGLQLQREQLEAGRCGALVVAGSAEEHPPRAEPFGHIAEPILITLSIPIWTQALISIACAAAHGSQYARLAAAGGPEVEK